MKDLDKVYGKTFPHIEGNNIQEEISLLKLFLVLLCKYDSTSLTNYATE